MNIWIGILKTAAVTITLPTTSLDEKDFYCYGHGLVNGEIKQVGNYQFDYIAKNMEKQEKFKCRVVFPTEVVKNINGKNKINANLSKAIYDYEDELRKDTYRQYIVAIVVNVITILTIGAMIFVFIHVYKKYDKEFTPKFDKLYLRELPYQYSPAEMSYLYYFGTTNDEDVTATLLDLVRRGFLKLDYFGSVNEKDPDFTILVDKEKCNKEQGSLLAHEKHLINWFITRIGDGEKVTIKQIEKYGKSYKDAEKFQEDAAAFKKKVKESGIKHDWFINTMKGKAKASSFGLIPIVMIIIFFLVGAMFNVTFGWNYAALIVVTVIYYIYVATIKKRSLNGAEEYAQWSAFKRFLEEFGTFKDYPMPGIVVWEEFLVYATSFKIADKVMEQLKVKLPNIPETEGTYLRSSYFGPRVNCFYITRSINHSMTTARTNAISSIAAHNASKFSSGGGHGGGFSGGSSFGGGGGGFRGGR